jgi:hypothetical protein
MKKILNIVALAVLALVLPTSCEGDHVVIETDWTTLETVELQDTYNKYMNGDWEYQYDDTLHYIEMFYTFNTKDSTLTGYYNDVLRTKISPDGIPEHDEWQLLWQGNFSAKWVLLHSVDLNQAYIYLFDLKYSNVHGALRSYDVLAGRMLFYGATKNTLTITTPLTFRRADMHHPSQEQPKE